jgi:hypothetical protein
MFMKMNFMLLFQGKMKRVRRIHVEPVGRPLQLSIGHFAAAPNFSGALPMP